MNDALQYIENDDNVISITGYLFPLEPVMPETFFSERSYCWVGYLERGWEIFSETAKAPQ